MAGEIEMLRRVQGLKVRGERASYEERFAKHEARADQQRLSWSAILWDQTGCEWFSNVPSNRREPVRRPFPQRQRFGPRAS